VFQNLNVGAVSKKEKKHTNLVRPLILTLGHFSVSKTADFSIGNFGILFLGFIGRPKSHHQSLFHPQGWVLPTVLLNGLNRFDLFLFICVLAAESFHHVQIFVQN
jgi:hypothetical protein